MTTESDTTAEPDLVSFGSSLTNSTALRVPAFRSKLDLIIVDYVILI